MKIDLNPSKNDLDELFCDLRELQQNLVDAAVDFGFGADDPISEAKIENDLELAVENVERATQKVENMVKLLLSK